MVVNLKNKGAWHCYYISMWYRGANAKVSVALLTAFSNDLQMIHQGVQGVR